MGISYGCSSRKVFRIWPIRSPQCGWGTSLTPSPFVQVVPKLLVAVNSWDPKVDPIPVHEWLHPWLPFIPDQLEQLYPTLRYKIGVV